MLITHFNLNLSILFFALSKIDLGFRKMAVHSDKVVLNIIDKGRTNHCLHFKDFII